MANRVTIALALPVTLLSAVACAVAFAGSIPTAAVSLATNADAQPAYVADKSGPAWQPEPAAAGEVVYAGFGIRSKAPGQATQPKTSLASTLAADTVREWRSSSLAPGEPDAQLRLITTGDYSPGAGEPVEGRMQDRLSWVLTFSDSPADIRGGYQPGSEGQALARPLPRIWSANLC